jgi:pimeloyl-ACP methyl ester carboxylesterase
VPETVGNLHLVRPLPRPAAGVLAVMTLALGLAVGCTTKSHGTGEESTSAAPTAPGSSSGTPTASPTPSATPVAFSDCSGLFNLSAAGIPRDRRGKLSFDCGRLAVPLDYAQPGGKTISIEVIRVHYRDQPKRLGSLLVNPGGPGASGVFLAISLAASLSDDVLQHFDIVGFDPRGVGLSSPIKCASDTQETQALALDVDVRTAAGLAQAKQQAAGFVTTCKKKYGTALANYNTVETAKDMDRIRAAVGDTKLNYLGFSYGTELGAVYAHLFPRTIRVAVLDGAVDPNTTGNAIASNAQQTAGFESAFDQFAADCAKRPACKPLGNARRAVEALEKDANAHPIRSSESGEERRATGGNVLYAVVSALYSEELWPSLGTALIDAQHGDAKGIFDLDDRYSERDPDGHYSNLLDVFQVVGCNDQPSDPTDAAIKQAAATWATQYPLFGLWSAESLFTCQSWPKDREPVPPETAAGSPPILVVGNLHDPATPYDGAVHLAKTLRTGVLLTWNGQGHTSYGQSACIDAKVNAYLISAAVPAPNTTCPR